MDEKISFQIKLEGKKENRQSAFPSPFIGEKSLAALARAKEIWCRPDEVPGVEFPPGARAVLELLGLIKKT